MLAADARGPARGRPAARISGLLASDGGGPSPATSCGSDLRIARLGRRGPQPRDVLRLGSPDCSPRTAGAPAPRRPAARISGLLASDGGAPAPRRPPARTTSWGEASEG